MRTCLGILLFLAIALTPTLALPQDNQSRVRIEATGASGRYDDVTWSALSCYAPPCATNQSLSLEPIQEVRIQEQRVGLVNRRSMMRIIARRMNAAADRA
jgi:hypothetical protein